MNKAFLREPDQHAEYCPRCGTEGEPVLEVTLRAWLTEAQRGDIAATASFCPSPTCEIAYFDVFERTIPASALSKPIYPKDPDAPLCACFGLTRDAIEEDARKGDPSRVKAVLQHAQSPGARCIECAANGRPCTAYVQRHYLQCLKDRKA